MFIQFIISRNKNANMYPKKPPKTTFKYIKIVFSKVGNFTLIFLLELIFPYTSFREFYTNVKYFEIVALFDDDSIIFICYVYVYEVYFLKKHLVTIRF